MIAIIDYGVGNLRSVEKAFHFIGSEAAVSSDREFVRNADAVVLPGVGAFEDAMRSLGKAGMIEVVKDYIRDDKPFLGICLGLQLLFERSEEGGKETRGLGIFKGEIKQLPAGMNLKVPHMGWNSLKIVNACPIFEGLPPNPYVYFVHSYYLETQDTSLVAARTNYGIEFDVAIGRGNVFATQFHPEKSGKIGLKILRNFVGLVENRACRGR